MKDGDYVATVFPGTTAGLQAAIDSLLGTKGKVSIGPGTLSITTAISVHSYCHIQGSGAGITVIKRATGSLTSSDAAHSGCTFIATPYGSNGTIATSLTGQVDIILSDMTLDGNQSNFGAVTVGTPRHFGIEMPYQDGLRLANLEIQEYLQSGIHLDEAREVFINNIKIYKVGQYASASARNGITLVNNNGFLSTYSRTAVITNCISDTVADAHFYVGNWTDVTFNNLEIRGGGSFGFEMETFTTSPSNVQRVAIVNVTADGLVKEFCRLGQLTGSNTTFQDILLRNCSCTFANTHNGYAVRAANGTSMILKRFKMSGCTFLNCNASDSANLAFFICDTTNIVTASQDITVEDCVLNGGVPASVLTSTHGMDFRGNMQKVTLQNNTVRDAQGLGIVVRSHTASASVVDLRITNCSVYNCTNDGICVFTNAASGTLKRVKLDGNYVEDSNEATGTNGIRVGPVQGTTTGQDFHVINNRVVKASSTLLTRGIRIEAGAGSTSDSYIIALNDFSGFSVAGDLEYASTGTSTNVQFSDPVARGADLSSSATPTLKLGTLFHVTGTTSTTSLTPCVTWDRRPITFIYDSTAGFTDGGNLKLNGDFVATADDSIVLQYDGTNWYELSRSVN